MPMPIAPNEPEYWHKRAEQARVLAEEYSDEMAKETMPRVAEDCDKLATVVAQYIKRTEQS
jgi:hypothetical protein